MRDARTRMAGIRRIGIYRYPHVAEYSELRFDKDVKDFDLAELVGYVEDNAAMLIPNADGQHELHFATRGHSAEELMQSPDGAVGVRVEVLTEMANDVQETER